MRTHDQRCYEDAYEQRQRDYHTEQALRDCTEAVDHADPDVIAAMLAEIGNLTIQIMKNGDIDEKIAFVDFVCSTITNKLINKFVDYKTLDDVWYRGFQDQKT